MKLKIVGLVVHIVLIVLLFLFTGRWLLDLTGVLLGLEIFAYLGLFVLAVITIPMYLENSRRLIYFYAVSLINLASLSILSGRFLFEGIIAAAVGIFLAAIGHRQSEEPEEEQMSEPTPMAEEVKEAKEEKKQEKEPKEKRKRRKRKKKK